MHARSFEPLPIVPDWHADETLYSWAARYYRLRGAGAVRPAGGLLFDTLHAYKEIEAPTRLHHFCRMTCSALGDVKSILLTRTPLTAFVPFLSVEQAQRFEACTQSDQAVGWMTRFGMRASALEQRMLRWCPDCVREDVATLGMPTWHLAHQLTGAWICLVHERPLNKHVATAAAWHLPPGENGLNPLPNLAVDDRLLRPLRSLSALASSLVNSPRVDIPSVHRIVVSELHEQRVLSSTKPISVQRLSSWFKSTPQARALECVAEAARLADGMWIHETLASRRTAHPIKWMLLLSAALNGREDYELIDKLHQPEAEVSWDDKGQGLLWADGDRRSGLIVRSTAEEAPTLAHAAAELNISVGTLRHHLRKSSCDAATQRAIQRRATRRSSAIKEIEGQMSADPECSRSDIHRRCSSAIAWLRRHEPEVLTSLLARIPERRPHQAALF